MSVKTAALLAMIEEKDAEIARLEDVIARLDAEIAQYIDANVNMRARLAAAEAVVEAARRVMDHPDGPGERCREKGRFIDGVCDGDCDVAIARYKALAAALDAPTP